MTVDLVRNRKRSAVILVCAFLALFLGNGCALRYATQMSLDGAQIREEKIQRIAIFVFDNPPLHLRAGMHISRLFELYLLRTGLYKIAERGEITSIEPGQQVVANALVLQFTAQQ